MPPPSSRTDLRALLEKVEAASPVEGVEVVADELAAMVGARSVRFLIADLSGRTVVRFGELPPGVAAIELEGTEDAASVKLAGTVYQQVLRTQRVDVRPTVDGSLLTVPVTDRGEAIGLLELTLPNVPDEQVVADVAAAAHALAYVVVANRRHTDLFEWGQRTTHFTLAAEIQRRLLPSTYTCEAGQFTIAGWLEPASSVGGDTFDYSLDRDALQVSVTDAAGHEIAAALLATLLVGSLRNERRRGADLGEQARNANDALVAHSAVGQFVTGQLLRVDLHTGEALIVNAGHPLPLRLRGDRVDEIELDVDLPFGLEPGRSFRLQQFPLQAGDRIVFVTDGMLERNAERLDVAERLGRSRNMHPRELVHALGAAVLRATGGDLRDDATIVCLDWHGGPPRRRVSSTGADLPRGAQ